MRTESDRSRWFRRCASISLFAVLWALVCLALPLWIVLAIVLDLGRAELRLPVARALAFFAVYLSAELCGVVAAGLLYVGLLGGHLVQPARWGALHLALQRWFTGTLFRAARGVFRMRVEVEGAALAEAGPYIVLIRHSSTADTVLFAALVANRLRIALRYVLKRELLWDPCLDIVGQRLRNAFVERDGAEGAKQQVAALAADLGPRDAVLIYPEGTRFDADKLARVQAKAVGDHADDINAFHHVMPPRLGGTLALLDAAPTVDVLFVDHVGFEGAATFPEFFGGGLIGKTLHMRLRRVQYADIPKTGRDAWLYAQWRETDRWVGVHRDSNEASRVVA